MDAPLPVSLNLREDLAEGFLLINLLQEGLRPTDPEAFQRALEAWIDQWQMEALRKGYEACSVDDACYAFCALVDETLLSRTDALRDLWEQAPLQARRFGDHLAGEGFFQRLEDRARDPHRHVQALGVFQACLRFGFQGRYRLEAPTSLISLRHRLDQDLLQMMPDPEPPKRPTPPPMSPGSGPLPIWQPLTAMGLAALVLFFGLRMALSFQMDTLFQDPSHEISHE